MSSITPDAVRQEISTNAMRVGNPITNANGTPAATAVLNLTADASSNLQTHARITGVQPTNTAATFNITGGSTSGLLTTTLVAGSDVTTATKACFIRLDLTDSNGHITNGSYYLEAFTLA